MLILALSLMLLVSLSTISMKHTCGEWPSSEDAPVLSPRLDQVVGIL